MHDHETHDGIDAFSPIGCVMSSGPLDVFVFNTALKEFTMKFPVHIDDLVLGAVDHQDGGGNFRDFVDAGKKKREN